MQQKRGGPLSIRVFRRVVRNYYRTHKRDFPWRRTKDPYKILVSEIMLQQTQTGRVVKKYNTFVKKFPNFFILARTPLRNVLFAWQGLGYNRRALYLKRLSEVVVKKYGGTLPTDPDVLQTFPGVGKATAGAIAAFAFNAPVPFIETNIRRTFIHFFFPKKKKIADRSIFALIERTLDQENPKEWYWALMDYGAMLGAGRAVKNPNRRSAHYQTQSPFRGSRRELRGKILRFLLQGKQSFPHGRRWRKNEVSTTLSTLKKEGFLV